MQSLSLVFHVLNSGRMGMNKPVSCSGLANSSSLKDTDNTLESSLLTQSRYGNQFDISL